MSCKVEWSVLRPQASGLKLALVVVLRTSYATDYVITLKRELSRHSMLRHASTLFTVLNIHVHLLLYLMPVDVTQQESQKESEPSEVGSLQDNSSVLYTPPTVSYPNLVRASHTKARKLRRQPSGIVDCHQWVVITIHFSRIKVYIDFGNSVLTKGAWINAFMRRFFRSWCFSVFGHSEYKGKQREIVEAAVLGSSQSRFHISNLNWNEHRRRCLRLSSYRDGKGIQYEHRHVVPLHCLINSTEPLLSNSRCSWKGAYFALIQY